MLNMTTEENGRSKLLRQLNNQFDSSELREISFTLHIDYENLRSERRSDFAMDLLRTCERLDRLSELVELCRQRRPAVQWPDPVEIKPLEDTTADTHRSQVENGRSGGINFFGPATVHEVIGHDKIVYGGADHVKKNNNPHTQETEDRSSDQREE